MNPPLALRANRASWAVADNGTGNPVEAFGVAGTVVLNNGGGFPQALELVCCTGTLPGNFASLSYGFQSHKQSMGDRQVATAHLFLAIRQTKLVIRKTIPPTR